MATRIDELWKLAEPYVIDAGLELVELEYTREREGFVLRVYIDYPPGPALPGDRLDESRAGSVSDSNGEGAGDPGNGRRAQAPASLDDVLPPRRVGFSECERISRDLSAALDVADVISHAYRLEVSSPGIERPLRRARDFQRFAGRDVRLRTTEPVEGRRSFKGTLRGVQTGAAETENDSIIQIECEGRSYQVPLGAVAKATLVPDWAALLRKSGDRQNERSAS